MARHNDYQIPHQKLIIAGIVLLLLSIASLYLYFFRVRNAQAAGSCANVTAISVNPTSVKSGEKFTCTVTVGDGFAGSKSIACGLSFNKGYPYDFCPSNQFFAGWSGNNANFSCIFPNTNLPKDISSVEVVGYDFKQECGPANGVRASITLIKDPNAKEEEAESPEEQQSKVREGLQKVLEAIFGESSGSDTNPPPQDSSEPAPTGGAGDSGGNKGGENTGGTSGDMDVTQILQTSGASYPENVNSAVRPCLKNKAIYTTAAAQTGVPWQVLAGIHYREGSCDPTHSLVSGRAIGANEPDLHGNCSSSASGPGVPYPIGGGCAFRSLLDTAIYAAKHLQGKIGKNPSTFAELSKALSYYNGGGNSNCGKTPYANCPKKFVGDDDTYVMNYFDSSHTPMYIVYCADYTLCNPPKKDGRPGTATAARAVSLIAQ